MKAGCRVCVMIIVLLSCGVVLQACGGPRYIADDAYDIENAKIGCMPYTFLNLRLSAAESDEDRARRVRKRSLKHTIYAANSGANAAWLAASDHVRAENGQPPILRCGVSETASVQ